MFRIGYLVAEFPGPTHVFFWRDILALRELGHDVDIVATRLPKEGKYARHAWKDTAIKETTYILPIGFRNVGSAIAVLFMGMPRRTFTCLRTVLEADEGGITERLAMLSALYMGASLVATARRRHWDHLHVAFPGRSAYAGMFAHMLSGISYSMTVHGAVAEAHRNQRLKWSRVSFAMAVSKFSRSELLNSVPGFSKPIAVSPLGLDMEDFQRTTPYEPWDRDSRARLLCAARLNSAKGQHDMIVAAKSLIESGIDVEVRLAGPDWSKDGNYTKRLLRLAEELGISDAVTFLGNLSEQEVKEELDRAQLFMLPSYTEGFPVSVIEAMAMGVPVVVTRVGGLPELVRDDSVGLCVESGQPEALADAARAILLDEALAKRLSAAARAEVRPRYTCLNNAKAFISCLENIGSR